MSTLEKKVKRGEVYYVRSFPTHGHEQRSGRPAVIISNNENNAHSDVVEICYLTLKEKPSMPTHVKIDVGPCINSTILCEQITSVAVDKLGDYMCFLPDNIMDEVDLALAISAGLEHLFDLKVESIPDSRIKKENKTLKARVKELENSQADAEMYKRMYNELLDRFIGGKK